VLIVDAQIHLWRNHLPTNRNHRQIPNFTAEDAIREMDEAGVDAAVVHPPGWDPESQPLALAAARQYPNRFAILGNFPLDKPESRTLVEQWKEQPGMLGLRWALNQPHQQTWASDGTLDWLWPLAERAGLPIAFIGPGTQAMIGRVAPRHPGLKLIVDHLGRTSGTRDAEAFANLDDMLALAKFPNVAVKATGAPSYSSDPYPYRNIHGYLRQIHDAFGPRRMFWGTDITRMPCSWKQCVTLFTEELPWLSEGDKEFVMGRALCDWLGWNIAG
jgi:predicted TIM-barrel fold metal-dependent hydrolase